MSLRKAEKNTDMNIPQDKQQTTYTSKEHALYCWRLSFRRLFFFLDPLPFCAVHGGPAGWVCPQPLFLGELDGFFMQ